MATSGASNSPAGGVAGIQSDPRQAADGFLDSADTPDAPEGNDIDEQKEEKLTKKLWKEYDAARKFDESFRKQVAIDRRYAAGTSDLAWAVTTNLIGAFIDILTSILYARDPDVSVRKTPQVDDSGTATMDAFARTLEIVISSQWRKAKLKKQARRMVRSALSTAEGWLKCTMVSEKEPQPEVETALNDARETLKAIHAKQQLIDDPGAQTSEDLDALEAEKQALVQSLQEKLELSVTRMFVIDFVPTERIQVATNVSQIADYLDAHWIGEELYMEKEDALAAFPRLTAEDMAEAKVFYQHAPKDLTTRDIDNVLPQGMLTAESAQAFTTSTSTPESPAFIRVVEVWDRRDKQIRTVIDGISKWAKEPFPPPYPTSRFFAYFYLSFYEVDGSRHPQSLSWRLYKLQDEYSASRSNFRITRERSIPGVLFNAAMLDAEQARKLSESKHQEYTALRPADPNIPLANCFAPKPVAGIDMRVFDPQLILSDMERMSGVQEALSSSLAGPGNPRTATEANIQQAGTNARTSSDRDNLELVLDDVATYTAEQALQCLTIPDVQRIAGPKAFWPEGMSIDDLFTLVEVRIDAGTTGKPRQGMDQQAWGTILPLIKQTIGELRQALATGDTAMAKVLTELVKETMLRMGDDSDPDRFLPQVPPPGSPGAGAPPAPIIPNINVSLRGELDPMTAAQLALPAVQRDAASQAPPMPLPGAAPPGMPPGAAPPGAPGAPSPPAPVAPPAGVPAAGPPT